MNIKQQIVNTVANHRERILQAERFLWQHPETGYREVESSAYLAERFRELGYDLHMAEDIPGFYTVVDTGRPGPEILVLGELDSIICPTHPEANKETGAVHSCGHNAQCAALLGVAAALKEPHVMDDWCGRIRLCAVPAEELLEIEYRSSLMEEGKIKYFGGKSEFLRRGYFDGVDMAMMVHTTCDSHFVSELGSVGCIAEKIIYKGKASHAGGGPWAGRNALYAATCGLNACNALRERFEEADVIRFHPIITSGGAMVNAIPETATIESYVRGMTFDAILKMNRQLNQALCGAALSLGTNVEIVDRPGYAPHRNAPGLLAVVKDAFHFLFPDEEFKEGNRISSGSTDMGDLSCIMPVVHPYAPGASGTSHGNDYVINDPETACVKNAMWQVAILHLLLEQDAVRAKEVLAGYEPPFADKEAFLAYQDEIFSDGDRIVYGEDKAEVRI